MMDSMYLNNPHVRHLDGDKKTYWKMVQACLLSIFDKTLLILFQLSLKRHATCLHLIIDMPQKLDLIHFLERACTLKLTLFPRLWAIPGEMTCLLTVETRPPWSRLFSTIDVHWDTGRK